jgi:hypothetical protein
MPIITKCASPEVKPHTPDNLFALSFIDSKDLSARESSCGWALNALIVVTAVKHRSMIVADTEML